MFCPTNYATSSNGPGRLKNTIYLASIIFSIVDTIYILIWINQKKDINFEINNKTRNLLLIILTLIICFFPKTNFCLITQELINGEAKAFAQEYDNRIVQMNNSKNEIVYVNPLPDSLVLKFSDINKDINSWENRIWNDYYQVKTVVFDQQ